MTTLVVCASCVAGGLAVVGDKVRRRRADHRRRAESRCRRVLHGLGWRGGPAQGRTRPAHPGAAGQGRGAALPGQRARPRQAAARPGPVARRGSDGRACRFGGPHERGHLPGPRRDHREDLHPSWPSRCHGHAGSRGGRAGPDLARRTLARVPIATAFQPTRRPSSCTHRPGSTANVRTNRARWACAIAAGAGRDDAARVRRGARRTGGVLFPEYSVTPAPELVIRARIAFGGGAATGRRPRGRAPRSRPGQAVYRPPSTRPCRSCTAVLDQVTDNDRRWMLGRIDVTRGRSEAGLDLLRRAVRVGPS